MVTLTPSANGRCGFDQETRWRALQRRRCAVSCHYRRQSPAAGAGVCVLSRAATTIPRLTGWPGLSLGATLIPFATDKHDLHDRGHSRHFDKDRATDAYGRRLPGCLIVLAPDRQPVNRQSRAPSAAFRCRPAASRLPRRSDRIPLPRSASGICRARRHSRRRRAAGRYA